MLDVAVRACRVPIDFVVCVGLIAATQLISAETVGPD
jgi:hypothetical protein